MRRILALIFFAVASRSEAKITGIPDLISVSTITSPGANLAISTANLLFINNGAYLVPASSYAFKHDASDAGFYFNGVIGGFESKGLTGESVALISVLGDDGYAAYPLAVNTGINPGSGAAHGQALFVSGTAQVSSTFTVAGQDASGFSVRTSSGIDAQGGVIKSTAVYTARLFRPSGDNFFQEACGAGNPVLSINSDGSFECDTVGSLDLDGVIGNEITNVTNATLVRSGAGTTGSPFTVALNLGSTNTWTADQRIWQTSGGGNIQLLIKDSKYVDTTGNFSFAISSATGNEGTILGVRSGSGLIGYGTRAPTAKMDVTYAGQDSAYSFKVSTRAVGATAGGWDISISTLYPQRVGIKTNFPVGQFEVVDWSSASAVPVFQVSANNNNGTTGGASLFKVMTGGGIAISSGTVMRNILIGNFTTDAPSVAAASTLNHNVVVTTLNAGDLCYVSAPALEDNLTVNFSSTSNTNITLRFNNPSILAVNPANQTYNYFCVRQ